MTEQEANAVRHFLSGYLHGVLSRDGSDVLRIVKIMPKETCGPPGFILALASGLELSVNVLIHHLPPDRSIGPPPSA